jgi:hypothetical protein
VSARTTDTRIPRASCGQRAKFLQAFRRSKFKQIIGSSAERLDPQKQLREAGYPYNYISTELAELRGKWEVVSSDVLLLKDAIADGNKNLSDKTEASRKSTLQQVESLFDRKFMSLAGSIVGCLALMYGAVTFLQSQGITGTLFG